MTRLAPLASLLVGILSTGCLIVPAKKVTSKPAPNEFGAATFATARNVELSARAVDDKVHVHAVRHGECAMPVYGVTEVTTEKEAKLGGADDPRAALFGLLLAPVLIPVSALVTGFVLAADDPSTDKQRKVIGTKRYACMQVAEGYVLHMTLPSGAVIEETTDDRGDATFVVPDSEHHTGELALAGDGAAVKQVAYSLPRPPITVTKEVALECAERHHITGALELKLSINDEGRVTRVWLSAGDTAMNLCITDRIGHLRYPERMRDATIKLPLTIPAQSAASL